MTTENPTACLLIIGNEVLSGRTRDANLQYIATRLGEIGIPMREARVIPDVPETIVSRCQRFDFRRLDLRVDARVLVPRREDQPPVVPLSATSRPPWMMPMVSHSFSTSLITCVE